jgi:hypothetical protein
VIDDNENLKTLAERQEEEVHTLRKVVTDKDEEFQRTLDSRLMELEDLRKNIKSEFIYLVLHCYCQDFKRAGISRRQAVVLANWAFYPVAWKTLKH